MKVKYIDSAVVTLCASRSYPIFVLVNLLITMLICDPNSLGGGIMMGIIIFILGPLNTLVLLLMYWLKINKRFLLDYRCTLLESIIYFISFLICILLLPDSSKASVIYLTLITFPIVITAGTGFLLKKYGKCLRFRKRTKSQ